MMLTDQRASLAGVSGTLWEIGTFAASVRLGQVAVTARGTPYRLLQPSSTFAPPAAGTSVNANHNISDVGDFLIDTTILLTPGESGGGALAALRFGTRLPTSDNRKGLERDRIDFFATLGTRATVGPVALSGEGGVGIHGTREANYEQSDVLIFNFATELVSTPLRPRIALVGHADGLPDRAIRGNEELAEVRLSLRSPGRFRVSPTLAVGLTTYSPSWGVGVVVGADW